MQIILLLLLCTMSISFKNFQKRISFRHMYALKKPTDKKPEDRDNFENFEEYSRIQDLEMQRLYFHKIYYQLNNMTQPTNVLQIDLRNMVNILDENMITNVLGHIPKRPETEDEIIEDSFEGFLKDEFAKIPKEKSNLINFREYYIWRKKAGLVLTEEEVLLYYNFAVGEGQLCDLMQFITINHLIDESDFPL